MELNKEIFDENPERLSTLCKTPTKRNNSSTITSGENDPPAKKKSDEQQPGTSQNDSIFLNNAGKFINKRVHF